MGVSGSTDDIAPVPGPTESSDDDAVPDLDVAGLQGVPISPVFPTVDEDASAGSEDEPYEATIDPGHDIPHVIVDPATRPCVYCGRAVPQRGASAPPVRYCLDNDGACARAAADRRRRDQDDPGLAGQVARTW